MRPRGQNLGGVRNDAPTQPPDEALPGTPVRLAAPPLLLREWGEADLPAMAALLNEPDIADRSPYETPFDLGAARRHLDMIRRTRAEKERLHLAITTDGHPPLGEVMLDLTRGTVGYAVAAAHRRRHIATRSVVLLTDYAHHTLGLPRVLLEIEADNHPSMAVAQAAGYQRLPDEPHHYDSARRRFVLHTWAHHPRTWGMRRARRPGGGLDNT